MRTERSLRRFLATLDEADLTMFIALYPANPHIHVLRKFIPFSTDALSKSMLLPIKHDSHLVK